MSLEDEKRLRQKEGVMSLLSENHKAELGEVLALGEKFREEGEKMKKEFWKKRGIGYKFVNLLMQYEDNKKAYMESLTEEEREKIDGLTGGGKEKFIEVYLQDKILYSGNVDKQVDRKRYLYEQWKDGKVVMEEGVTLRLLNCNIGAEGAEAISNMELKWGVELQLYGNNIGDAGAEAISKMELKEGVKLYLGTNKIGAEGAEAISKMKLKEGVTLDLNYNLIGAEGAEAISRMKLKEGVTLDLNHNLIGAEGAEAISRMKLKEGVMLDLSYTQIGAAGAESISKMELREGVGLDLSGNKIGDVGAEAIMKMELKEGVFLDLSINLISEDMQNKLKEWAQGYKDKGINCAVVV